MFYQEHQIRKPSAWGPLGAPGADKNRQRDSHGHTISRDKSLPAPHGSDGEPPMQSRVPTLRCMALCLLAAACSSKSSGGPDGKATDGKASLSSDSGGAGNSGTDTTPGKDAASEASA